MASANQVTRRELLDNGARMLAASAFGLACSSQALSPHNALGTEPDSQQTEAFLDARLSDLVHPRSMANLQALDQGARALSGTPRWSLRDKTVQLDGKPFFPFGIFHTTHRDAEDAQRLKDLETVAAAGLNIFHTPIDSNDGPLLNRAAQLGVPIALEFNEDPTGLLRRLKGRDGNLHPAIAFLSTFDDVDSEKDGARKYSPARVLQHSRNIQLQAPTTVTTWSGGFPKRIGEYLKDARCVAQQQVYPIPAESLSSTTLGYLKPFADSARAVNSPAALVANLQSFAWEGERFPTRPELRNMTYQALIQGMKGIIYYTFKDGGTDLNNQPGIVEELGVLAGEVKSLMPFLLNGTHSVLSTRLQNRLELFSAKWELEGHQLFIVANAAPEARTYSLDFLARSGSLPVLVPFDEDKPVLVNSAGQIPLESGEVVIFGVRKDR